MKDSARGRNHVFDGLRIVFATLVLLAHSPELVDGNRSRELFGRLTHSSMSFGEVGVDGFFLLSGYLIVRSWLGDPEFLNFLWKRVLRIVPGYLFAAIVSTVLVGFFASRPHFFSQLDSTYPISLLFLSFPHTPKAFPGTSVMLVNGALWTISYEFRCYLIAAFLGMLGILRRPVIFLGLTAFFLLLMANQASVMDHSWRAEFEVYIGRPEANCRFIAIFLVGAAFYLFREGIRFVPWAAAMAAMAMVAVIALRPALTEIAIVLFGSYLLFYLGAVGARLFSWMINVPDISYGIYLYGWPVLGFGVFYFHPSPWVLFVCATLICYCLGWLSWHYVERPILRLKRRATAPLPPS